MAKHMIFIEGKVKNEQVGTSMSTSYSYDTETMVLTVNWRRQEVFNTPATLGDAFVVDCRGGIPVVKPLGVPRKKTELLMWLAGFNKACRTNTREGFEELLEYQRHEYNWWNYRDDVCSGNNWAFAICNRSDCGGVHHIAAYVGEDIETEDIFEFLKAYVSLRPFYYPDYFVNNTLVKLGLNDEQIVNLVW